MAEPERLELVLLGQKLTVRTEATPDYLRSLVDFLEERVGVLQRSGVRDPFKALALAALDIADELHRAREAQNLDQGEVGNRLRAVIARLDELSRQAP